MEAPPGVLVDEAERALDLPPRQPAARGVSGMAFDMGLEQGGGLLQDRAGRLHVDVDRPFRIDDETS